MRSYASQKAALTRAIKTKDADIVLLECRRVVAEWNQSYWPDDWARWQRALDDIRPWNASVQLDSL